MVKSPETQIGNVSVKQMVMSMGSNPDHLVEALEEVFCLSQSTKETGYPGKGDHLTSTIL